MANRLFKTNISVIREMMYLGAEEEAKGKKIVSLGVDIPFYSASKHIHDHVVKILKTNVSTDKYTLLTGLPKLRKIVAQQSTQTLGFTVLSDKIQITPNSMAASLYAILVLVNPGTKLLHPTFPHTANRFLWPVEKLLAFR